MYYLHHYFNPDFNHKSLVPLEVSGGRVEYRCLGYVQNVVAGQPLAEIIPLEETPEHQRDPRFIYSTFHLPCGPNCEIHPTNPNRIIASANGYVFYHDGLISIKKMLNVRGNIGLQTGNIFFIGDIAVHGDIQTGFAVQSRNVLVKGHIESAKVKALHDIVCLSGVKGAAIHSVEAEEKEKHGTRQVLPSSLLDAGGNVRLPFCENVQIRAKGNVVIDGSCLHCTIYTEGNLVVKGRLQGGTVYANGVVYVEGQLGSDFSSPTRIMMGYDPFAFLQLQKLESRIAYLESKVAYFKKLMARGEVMVLEHGARHALAVKKLSLAQKKRTALWRKLVLQEEEARQCRVIAPGKVMPGCEVAIGTATFTTETIDSGKIFLLEEGEVLCRNSRKSFGAMY